MGFIYIYIYLLGARIHVVHSSWYFTRHKVAGRLFHRHLTIDGGRHVRTIPMQTLCIVPVEEMHFTAGRPYVRMQTDELQQSPSSALLYADDQSAGKMSVRLQRLLSEQSIFWGCV